MAVLGLAALAVVAAGCAIPTQSAPSKMAPTKVPFDLLDPHPPTTTTTTQPKPSSYVAVQVFFLNTTNELTAVQRFVAAPAPLIRRPRRAAWRARAVRIRRGRPPPSRAT